VVSDTSDCYIIFFAHLKPSLTMTPDAFDFGMEELKLLKALDEGTASYTGEKFFDELVRNLAIVLGIKGAWVTEYDRKLNRLRALSFWMDGSFIDDYEYPVKGTPCEHVIEEKRFLHVKNNVIELYPDDPDLRPFNAVSYLGAPLIDSNGQILGNLAILDDAPLPGKERLFSIFRIFTARASAELQRILAEKEVRKLEAETSYLRQEVLHFHRDKQMIGSSASVVRVLKQADQVARTDATVLITGETGTGKELMAIRIHGCSRRNDKPFVKINCATIPAALIESELFGHIKGAFTGAVSDREGRFKIADGGTLFLDEIGELPFELQPKLLRVLQEGEFEAVGSSDTIKTDVRIIAATNRNLLQMIRENRFREDLYYRLNIFPVHLPPLRERKEDLLLLAQTFAEKYSKQYNIPVEPLTGEHLPALISYSWPGNVRELQNIMERAVITSADGTLNLVGIVNGILHHSSGLPGGGLNGMDHSGKDVILTEADLRDIERSNMVRALKKCKGRVSGKTGAASLLGIPSTTFRSRMESLNIRVTSL
jgi:formate hydrogenlyase transcriptional activator